MDINLLKTDIEIDILLFKDGIRHIDLSLERGHITKDQAHSQKNRLASIYADHITCVVARDKEPSSRADRYLVQFRRQDEDDFETDCGFRDGQLDLARYHVHLVLDTVEDVAEGQVWDTESQRCVYGYSRDERPCTEEQINAVFGEPTEFEDPNGSDGVDDDPFVKYSGPDDPEIRYR